MAKKQHKTRRPIGSRQGQSTTSDSQVSRPGGSLLPSKKESASANSTADHSHGWQSFLQLECKGISLTLGLPFAIVLVMIVLVLADWSKIGGHINLPAFMGISTFGLGTLRKVWKH